MERKMMQKLLDWKKSQTRQPLLLCGAKQVGKTYLILSFGKENYTNIVHFNLEKNLEASKIIERETDIDIIIRDLSKLSGKPIFKNDTLLFFDEIRSCKKAMVLMKQFSQIGTEYHIIASGNLFDLVENHHNKQSLISEIKKEILYPMDVEEFLWAISGKEITETIRNSFKLNTLFALHETVMEFYQIYLITGGMPSVVQEYLNKRDFDYIPVKQKDIFNSIIADIVVNTLPNETTRTIAAFNSIPQQLSKRNRKFQYSAIKKKSTAYEYEYAVYWLENSGVVNKTLKINGRKLLYNKFADQSSFKLYFNDTGLLCEQFAFQGNGVLFENTQNNSYSEVLIETYVVNALRTAGLFPYYWESDGKYMVDFVVRNSLNEIIPIDIESSLHMKSKRMDEFSKRYNSPYSITISSRNFEFDGVNKTIPVYAIFCLEDL